MDGGMIASYCLSIEDASLTQVQWLNICLLRHRLSEQVWILQRRNDIYSTNNHQDHFSHLHTHCWYSR